MPTHSRTEWAPRPPVNSRTRSTASSPRSLTTSVARLWHKTTPEQGRLTYTYNTDDTVNVATDARGAASTFTYTAYERDPNGTDEAMMGRYNRWHAHFNQPDPYRGSYNMDYPQSFNRYSYVRNDPVSFVDPTGL